MQLLVIGGGGREHAIINKLLENKKISKIYSAPGNGGIGEIAECIDIEATDIDSVVKFSKERAIDLVVVTPDDPLALGMVDALEKEGIKAFGPRKNAAILEASKIFAKAFMKRHNIPTGAYEVFENSESALKYIENLSFPIVIKADGLALGKGVVIAQDLEEAKKTIVDFMSNKTLGDAGNSIIIEEYLEGPEISLLAFTDGVTTIPMVSSQDYKKIYDGDKGPNTGGMGVLSPSANYSNEISEIVENDFLFPTVDGLREEGRLFKGIIYLGLIITDEGPKLLEYNARFGDPETQAILPRLKSDLLAIFEAIIEDRLCEIEIDWDERSSHCVVIASGGYPGEYEKGQLISGLEDISNNVKLFHAGTIKKDNKFYTNGGRVLAITSIADNIKKAKEITYDEIEKINFKKMYYRKDIGS